MTNERRAEKFQRQIKRGRKFEQLEKSQWAEEVEGAQYEVPTQWQGKRGRIDIFLPDQQDDFCVVVEIKASDWDAMKPERVRPNALRHANQLWRYVEAELDPLSVVPAIVYPASPRTPGRKEEVEAILNDLLIQVVWRGDGEDE
jgi:hypothetical protein